jgi:N-acetylmuramoyl-L-alanine amidase
MLVPEKSSMKKKLAEQKPTPEKGKLDEAVRAPLGKSEKPITAQEPLTYVVRPGDTLTEIAMRQETTISALLEMNGLTTKSTLRVDQKLKIPRRSLTALPRRLATNPKRLQVRKEAAIWAKRNAIPRDLLEAMMWHESGFDQTKVSSTGAIGVGQIMPNTGVFIERELIGKDLNPYEMAHNVRMSARYLRYLLKVTGGNSTRALYAYYQGIGSIQKNGIYAETRQYARNIQALRVRFKHP